VLDSLRMKIVFDRQKCLPFLLSAVIVAVDQGVKSFIAYNWPLPPRLIRSFFGDFIQIWHVRNQAIAFSLGHNLPEAFRPFLFVAAPLLVLGFLLWYYFTSREFRGIQRWAVAGIIGGGLGNIMDRIFRPDGVVDFISVKFPCPWGSVLPQFDWGSRWPTFNVADSCVVVCCFILLVTIIAAGARDPEAFEDKSEEEKTKEITGKPVKNEAAL